MPRFQPVQLQAQNEGPPGAPVTPSAPTAPKPTAVDTAEEAELEEAERDAGQGETPEEKSLSVDAKEAIAESSIVTSVFRDCVDPATQRAVERG